jgi:hypothetical protein
VSTCRRFPAVVLAVKKAFHLTLELMLPSRFANLAELLTSALFVAPRRATNKCAAVGFLLISALMISCGMPAVLADETSPARSVRAAGRVETGSAASIHWKGVPLHDALGRLNELYAEPVFADRRLDLSQRVSLDVEAASLDDVLSQLSATASLGYSKLNRLLYLGPPSAAEQLRTIAALRGEEVRRLPTSRRSAFALKQPVTWPRLTEPRELINALARRRGWRIGEAERIPHDLWPAGELPALPYSDQLTVMLIGFDLTFEIKPAERTLEIVPLRPLTVNRRYRLPRGFPNPDALLQHVPAARARVEGEMMSVDARIEDHEKLAKLLRGRSTQTPASRAKRQSKQVYTLRVQEQSVGAVLEELAERLGWQIEIDSESIRAAGLSLEKRVSFSVENSDEDELLDAVLRPAELDYLRENGRLRIVPRDRAVTRP